MADIGDMADEVNEVAMRNALEYHKNAVEVPELSRTGRCHWCDEKLGDLRVFCDEDCRDDYERSRR